MSYHTVLGLVFGWIIAILMGGFGAIILWKMARNRIDLKELIDEPGGGASLSRFQFLVFTFVIALSYFLLVVEFLASDPLHFELPNIAGGALALLGISSGSYVLAKGIQSASGGDEAETDKGTGPTWKQK
jgi:hypothetical protein